MSWLSGMLRRLGITSPFTADEVLNAEAEDMLHEQRKVIAETQKEFRTLSEKSVHLRNVMSNARLQVDTFAQFEQRIRDMSRRRREHS